MKARQEEFAEELLPNVVSTRRRMQGLVALVICLVASLLLVLQQFGAIGLPGFGPHSFCAAIAKSRWGSILGWPVSFVGLSYFTGLTAAWALMTPFGASVLLRVTVRLGALASSAYLVIMCVEQNFCIYCVVIHASNLAFWIILERTLRAHAAVRAEIVTVFAGFALVSALLNVALSEQGRLATERIAQEMRQSPPRTAADSGSSAGLSGKIEKDVQPATTVSKVEADVDRARIKEADAKVQADRRKRQEPTVAKRRGRTDQKPYRMGPEQANVRLVVFYDYQSAACWQIERDVQALWAKYGEKMSVTARHFPLCAECNLSLESTTHPNACRAALAAETAGLLKGNDGFWQMHRWLFEQRGNFTADQLKTGLIKLGYDDTERFLETMNSPSVLAGVLADIVEAQSLQIQGPPAVIYNGTKLAGLQAGTGLLDAIIAVAKKNRPLSGSEQETPARSSPIDTSITDTFSESMQLAASASTVRIVNTTGRSVGSGAIIAFRDPFVYVLTAYHVVPQIKRVEVQTYSSQSYPKPAGIYSWATVVATSESADLALIRFTSRDPMPKPLPIVSLELVPQESRLPVLTIGYDDQASMPICVANEVIETKRVRREVGDAAVTVWEVARESAKGRSGGPLVGQRGFLLGIASGISEGKGYFTHATEIHRFLEQNGLEAILAPASQPE